MAAEANPESTNNGGSHSAIVAATVAAAATGAAAYGLRRLRSGQDEEDVTDEGGKPEAQTDRDEQPRGNLSEKRTELTQALSARASDAKKAASRLKPGGGNRRSMVDSAWQAASDHALPVAREAAASLGTTVAKKAPAVVRDELMPPFIEGFQKQAS